MLRGDGFCEALTGVLVGEADIGTKRADLVGCGVLLALEGNQRFHEDLLFSGGDVLAACDVRTEDGLLDGPCVPADDIEDILLKPAIVEIEGLGVRVLEIEDDFGLHCAAFILTKSKVALFLRALELIEIEEATYGRRGALGKEGKAMRGDHICEGGFLVGHLVSRALRSEVALLLKKRYCSGGTLLKKEWVGCEGTEDCVDCGGEVRHSECVIA